jgi:uncharacterized protein (TIGR02453 family)
MTPKFPGFSPDALAFLRALKRNNRREWFKPRQEKHDTLIKAPMLELVDALNHELANFAPDYITPAPKAVYRIYRDTRFAKDKTPYKTHIAAIFPRHSAVKREGAVFYFHFSPTELLVFGGVYSPDRNELLAYRNLLQEQHEEFQAILSDKQLKRLTGGLQGAQLTRMPKGFSEDHPAEALLRHKQWYLECSLDLKLVTSPKMVAEIAKRFAAMTPMIEFMNRPFIRKDKRKSLQFMAF